MSAPITGDETNKMPHTAAAATAGHMWFHDVANLSPSQNSKDRRQTRRAATTEWDVQLVCIDDNSCENQPSS